MVMVLARWSDRSNNLLRPWLIGAALALSACDAGNAEPAIAGWCICRSTISMISSCSP